MSENVSAARLIRRDERLSRVIAWLKANEQALVCQQGRMWVEWDYDKIKVGIETSSESSLAGKSR